MLIRPKDRKNIITSGIFIGILLIIGMIFIFMLSKESALFSSKIELHTIVKNVKNLKEGAAVQLKGLKIGTIKSIEFKDLEKIKIIIGVNANYKNWIREDSYISFRTQGVLGDRFMEILGGTSDSPVVKDGDQINSREDSEIDTFINQGGDILTTVNKVLTKIDLMMGPIENNRLDKILNNLENTTKNTNLLLRKLNQGNIGEVTKNLEKASTSLSEITQRIENGPGTIHSLIYDPTVHDDVKSLLGGAKRNKILKYFIRETIKKSENQ